MSTEQGLRKLVRGGMEAMKKRREVVTGITAFAERDPEKAARGLVVLATKERDGLRRLLEERFGFAVAREGGWKFRFHSPRRLPRAPEEKARWADAVVMLMGYARALDVMRGAEAQHRESADRSRMVVRAFCDAYERTPVLYNAFGSDFSPDEFVRDYASAMAAAWARSHYTPSWNPRAAFVLKSPDWASRLVAANAEAWKDMTPKAPIIRGGRFRDWLEENGGKGKDALGRRMKIRLKDGKEVEDDLINCLDHALSAENVEHDKRVAYTDDVERVEEMEYNKRKARPPVETRLAERQDEEARAKKARDEMLRRALDANLTPREMQLFRFFAENPVATNKQAAARFGISKNTVKSLKRRYRRALGA